MLTLWLSGILCLVACVRDETGVAKYLELVRPCCVQSAQLDAEEACTTTPIGVPRMERTPSFETCCFLVAHGDTQAPVSSSRPMPDSPAADGASMSSVVRDGSTVDAESSALHVQNRGDTHLRCCVFLI